MNYVTESFIVTCRPTNKLLKLLEYFCQQIRVLLPGCLIDLVTCIYLLFSQYSNGLRVSKVGTLFGICKAIQYNLPSNYKTYAFLYFTHKFIKQSCILVELFSSQNFARLPCWYFYNVELKVQRRYQMACYSYRFLRKSCN
jgi:hypothetical protein